MNIDNRDRGLFARMDVYVNLIEPLISQVIVNGRTQRVEDEFLLTVCSNVVGMVMLKRFAHLADPFLVTNPSSLDSLLEKMNMVENGKSEINEKYGP